MRMRTPGRGLYYGWYVLTAVSGLNFANSATAIGVLTVFIVPLSTDFGWTRTQISAVTSVGAVLGALAAPFTGRLTDKLGARLPLTLAASSIILAMLSLASMQSLTWFYLGFGLARLADQALVQAPSPPAIAKWFQRYRGRAMAALFFASSAGGVALPILVQVVITAWHWRLAWVTLGGIMLVMGLLPCALLVRRQPEDLGLPIDGEMPSEQAASSPTISLHEGDEPSSKRAETWQLREALTTSTLWLILGCMFIVGIAWTGVGLHLVPYLLQQGIASPAAVGAVSLTSLASSVSTLLWGFFADRLAARYLLVVTSTLRAASIAILLGVDTLPKAYMFAILQGCADGGLGTLTTVLLANYYGGQHLGSIYGVVRAAQVAGFALGPLIAGATFDLARNYHGAFVAFLALSIVGTLLIGLARQPLKTPAGL
jgi:MFS family permease